MTDEQRSLLKRINDYSEKVLFDIDPQKVPVSQQLGKLRPSFQEIAVEKNMSLQDVFIMYMDIQSEATCASEAKLQNDLKDINEGNDDMPLLYHT